MKSNRVKVHVYHWINFDFTEKANAKINMDNYDERTINEFLIEISRSDTDLTTAGNKLLKKVTFKGWIKKKLNSSILKYQ